MNIQSWLAERAQKGTMANAVRSMVAAGRPFAELENSVRQQYLLEALMQHGGSQKDTAAALGIARVTIRRALAASGIRARDIQALSRYLQRRQ